jgi:hypothetical protein
MTGCFSWLVLLTLAVLAIVTLLRWFEQTTEAVDNRCWTRVLILVLVPFSVWFFTSRVSAGRPTAVPRHEPVRGFGAMPRIKDPPPSHDQPPPGTPKEFIGMPVIPPKKTSQRSGPDPEKLAKLRERMKEQGMLNDDQKPNDGG